MSKRFRTKVTDKRIWFIIKHILFISLVWYYSQASWSKLDPAGPSQAPQYMVLEISLLSDRRRFVTIWRYNFDHTFQGAVKAYKKHQKLLDFLILSTKLCLSNAWFQENSLFLSSSFLSKCAIQLIMTLLCDWTKYDLVYQLLTLLRVFKDLPTLH